MRTIRLKVYQFGELADAAKKIALKEFETINVDFDWWDTTYEDAENIGLKITGFDLDQNRSAKGEFILAVAEVAANIFRDHGAQCETYKTAESFMAEWQPVFDTYMQTEEGEEKLMELEDDFLKALLEDYSIILQNECEYLMSEAAIIETIEANEYEFYENGKQFHLPNVKTTA